MLRRIFVIATAVLVAGLSAAAQAGATEAAETASICRIDAHVSILPVLTPALNIGLPQPPTSNGGSGHSSFQGACAVEGDVTFTPGLTLTQQASEVTYDAAGTCTGTLDGRSVTNAAVHLYHEAKPSA